MAILLVFILFILLLLLPFLPGILELIQKKDAEPLFISMDYIRNPRYFGKSFKRLIHRATAGFTLSPGMRDIKLSKSEKVELTHSIDISAAREIKHLIYTIGNLVTGSNVQLDKEVYVTGNAVIGADNIIQALATDGGVTVSHGVQFKRWLDAEGDIHVADNCNLGISSSSGSSLFLSKDCIFRRIYGMPIITGDRQSDKFFNPDAALPAKPPLQTKPSFIRNKDSSIPPGSIIDDSIVFLGDVKIGPNSLIRGTIKSYGKIVLAENVIIDGNIFADDDIFVGHNARIKGHVFSQSSVYISHQTIISSPDRIKTVIGKKSIKIEQNVTIYGFITTEGSGEIL
jgi:predicted acyltransferase (DUF342 family)